LDFCHQEGLAVDLANAFVRPFEGYHWLACL
jgi:hypothetical protein